MESQSNGVICRTALCLLSSIVKCQMSNMDSDVVPFLIVAEGPFNP